MSEDEGTLGILACHGVWTEDGSAFLGEHPEDEPVYERQLREAARTLAGEGRRLVISGGPTQAGRRCSEARSYLERGRALGLGLEGALLEEHALTSVENLLLGVYRHHRATGRWPARVEVVSWGFKQARFEAAWRAIGAWERAPFAPGALAYRAVGDLAGAARDAALAVEAEHVRALAAGLEASYRSAAVRAALERRDVHGSRAQARAAYRGYPLPF